jgi:alanyl-tRNA synthetase
VIGPNGSGEVVEIYRVGDDQVIRLRVDGRIDAGDEVQADVDTPTRRATQANHTATHVLHWALREMFGTTTRQAGSYVGPDKLRFDFTLKERMGDEQRARIEEMVNGRVAEDTPVGWQVMPRAEADALGAIGLFGEKYGDLVRVVSAGDFSKELCGGTHVARTGEIGPFKIVSEGGIGSGTRRIEALTGAAVVGWHDDRERELQQRVAEKDERIRQLEGELKRARSGRVDAGALAGEAVAAGPVRMLVREVEADEMDDLLAVSDQVKARLGDAAAIVLGARANGKAMLVANLASAAIASGLSAGEIIKQVAPLVGGAGGGRDGMARAGGKNPAGLPRALDAARALIEEGTG